MTSEDDIIEHERILRKYRDGRDLDPEDAQIVSDLCSIGFMKKGISFLRQKITARTIGIGLKIIE